MVSPESAEKLASIRLQIAELLEVQADASDSETVERILDLLNQAADLCEQLAI